VAIPTDRLRRLVSRAEVVLWDFDGPICRLFAGHPAPGVAAGLVDWLEARGLRGLLTEAERHTADPHAVLRAVDRAGLGRGVAAELEERLTQEELRATATAMPTAWADPLIRTWTALGARLAVASNNSPRVIGAYLAGRGLADCFGPHIYGRDTDPHRLKPDPYHPPDRRQPHRPRGRPPRRHPLPRLRPQRPQGPTPVGRRGTRRDRLPGTAAEAAARGQATLTLRASRKLRPAHGPVRSSTLPTSERASIRACARAASVRGTTSPMTGVRRPAAASVKARERRRWTSAGGYWASAMP
jgi:hypothetical protein